MGYRGEDVSRNAGSWADGAQGYGSDDYDDYASGGTGHGYQTGGGYGAYPQRPGQEQYPGYGQHDAYGQPSYGGPGGYAQQPGYGGEDDYGYQQPAPGYDPAGGDGRGYRGPGGGFGQPDGYPARPGGSGAYPVVPDGAERYEGRDAGNDWYGGQPAAASGASFADTGSYALNGRIIEEYGTGPNETMRNPASGYPAGQGQPPGPAQSLGRPKLPAPARPVVSGPQSVPGSGPQAQYDDYDPYIGYGHPSGEYPTAGRTPSGEYPASAGGDYAGHGPDAYDQDYGYVEPGRRGQAYDDGYDRPGYDDYPADDSYQDRYADDGNGRGPGRGTGAKGNKAPKKAARPAGRSSSRGGRARGLALGASAVVIIAAACAAAYFLVFKPHSSTVNPNAGGRLPTGGAAPSAEACVKQYGTYCHIQYRTDDPTPLTLAELFAPEVNYEASNGQVTSSFTLEATKLDKTCSDAVIGQDLISALKKGACTQVLRASYLSGDGKIMGTIGVINLDTTNHAHYAGRVVGQNDFIAPLKSKKGTASKLGQGTGVVEAQYKGHYLILTWAQLVEGTKPATTAQDDALEQFSNDLVAGTANIPLSQRMVTGAAPTPSASASAS